MGPKFSKIEAVRLTAFSQFLLLLNISHRMARLWTTDKLSEFSGVFFRVFSEFVWSIFPDS